MPCCRPFSFLALNAMRSSFGLRLSWLRDRISPPAAPIRIAGPDAACVAVERGGGVAHCCARRVIAGETVNLHRRSGNRKSKAWLRVGFRPTRPQQRPAR